MNLIQSDRPIIAVDFDGTIVEHRFPAMGKLMPGFKCWYKRAKSLNCALILWTCREGKELKEAKKYLESIGCAFDSYNENCGDFKRLSTRKVCAMYYIDDRAGFVSWEQELENLKDFMNIWKTR